MKQGVVRMKLELTFGKWLCYCSSFEINDIRACSDDFGNQYDTDADNAPDYCCADMRFFPRPATQVILDKYNITLDEYNEICEKLEEGLSFGSCGWCG